MKTKITYWIIIWNIFSVNFLFSQTLSDTLFKNVVKIDNSNISQIGNCFLVDIPLVQENEFLIIYNNSRIPNKMFFNPITFAYNLKEFIIMAPDNEYYAAVANNIKNTNITCAEPIVSNKYYHIKRQYNQFTVDSITIQGNKQPLIKFKNKQDLSKDSILAYYSENIKYDCCPKQMNWALKSNQEEFVRKFEKDYNLKIEKTFSENIKEDEYVYFYTFYNLSIEDKLSFILKRNHDLIPDKHLKKMAPPYGIYFPYYFPKKNKVEIKSN
ncbi:MAG: hypothetical protein V4572_01535 [Bacteroidota bacterium]